MKIKHFFIFIIPLVFILLPDDVFARERIELSSYNGTVLWSSDSIEPQEANISNVQYIIFYFDLNLTSQSNYILDNEFIYGVYGNKGTGVDLVYLLLSGKEVAFTHSFSRLAEQYVNPFFIHKYINHINFTSNYTGFIQVQLTYRLVEPVYIGGVGITNQNLIYEGSNSPDTNETINNSTSNIITNNNTNTDKIIDSNKTTQDKIDKTNDLIEDDKIGDAQDKADDFFGNFESDDFGLSDIITLPLTFIQGLSSSTCYNLELPLPFVDTNVTLPCMTSIYQTYFGSFLTLYQTITTGFIAYWVCINIFRLVQGFKNPDNNQIEVMEL